jgi:hypothetical protein
LGEFLGELGFGLGSIGFQLGEKFIGFFFAFEFLFGEIEEGFF